MEMMAGLASCLIRTRQYEIGYPSRFSHHPQGMKPGELENLFEYIQAAMDEPDCISESSGNIRRIVIGTGKYLVMGISGYARDFVSTDTGVNLVDKVGRPSYGFMGFVWNLESAPLQVEAFPSLTFLSKVFNDLIVKHWMDFDTSDWASKVERGIPIPYEYPVEFMPVTQVAEDIELNHNGAKIYIFDNSKSKAILQKAINEACRKQVVSVCTDLYLSRKAGSCYLNMTADSNGGPVCILANVKHEKSSSAQVQSIKAEKASVEKKKREPYESEYRTALQKNHSDESEQNNLLETGKKAAIQLYKNFTSGKDSKTVHFTFLFNPECDVNQILEGFLSQLVAKVQNDYQCRIQVIPEEYRLPGRYEVDAVISGEVKMREIYELCGRILKYYCDKGVASMDKNRRCMREIRILYAEKSGRLGTGKTGEIHVTPPRTLQKNTQERPKRSPQKPSQETPQKVPQNEQGYEELIRQIKQENVEKPKKNNHSSDDLFKI